MNNMTDHEQNFSYNAKYENRNDSLTLGITAEKYFADDSYLLRFDFSYANMNLVYSESTASNDGTNLNTSDYSQTEKQKFYNFNMGIGNKVAFNKFNFSFGVYIPLTFVPKGEIIRDVKSYNNGTLMQKTYCTGTYKSTMAYGIGTFAEINTTLFRHISVGADFTYQLQHLSRKLDWHGEFTDYSGTPYTSTDEETLKFKNFFTSRIIPSIVISYTFDCKKKSESLVNN
jgi:hypothetical protein